MINMEQDDTREAVLFAMHDSDPTFHLTGSRLFGRAKPDSDWDFFTADLPQVRQFLTSIGFKVLSGSHYDDLQAAIVFRHPLGIDVQCVKDVDKKFKVQKALKAAKVPFWMIDKGSTRTIWNAMYLLLENG